MRPGQRTATAWPPSATRTTTSWDWSTPAQPHQAPVYASDYSDELDAVDAHGHVPVPTGPGLGAPVDWDWVSAHQTDQVVYE